MQNAGWKEGILKRSAEKELESGKPLSRLSTLYEHVMAKHAMSFYKNEFFSCGLKCIQQAISSDFLKSSSSIICSKLITKNTSYLTFICGL